MALKLRPTGLGSGIDKDRRITPSTVASGVSAASMRPAAVPKPTMVLVADRQPSDGALGSRRNLGGGQGAVSEELGRVEGRGRSWRRWRDRPRPKRQLCEVNMPGATVPAAHAVWSVIQSEDGYAWHAQLNWDNGRQDRVLRFEVSTGCRSVASR